MVPALICVEGKDDEAFLSRLANFAPLTFRACGGYESLRKGLRTFLKSSGLERIAVIVDADHDPANRWTSLRQRFTELGYRDLAPGLSPEGLVLAQPGSPVLGVWIMPDNVEPGCLEDFVTGLIPESDVLWTKAVQFVATLQDRQFPLRDQSKAELYTWLAIQREPGIRPGIALDKGLLQTNSGPVVAIRSWLNRWLTYPSALDSRPDPRP